MTSQSGWLNRLGALSGDHCKTIHRSSAKEDRILLFFKVRTRARNQRRYGVQTDWRKDRKWKTFEAAGQCLTEQIQETRYTRKETDWDWNCREWDPKTFLDRLLRFLMTTTRTKVVGSFISKQGKRAKARTSNQQRLPRMDEYYALFSSSSFLPHNNAIKNRVTWQFFCTKAQAFPILIFRNSLGGTTRQFLSIMIRIGAVILRNEQPFESLQRWRRLGNFPFLRNKSQEEEVKGGPFQLTKLQKRSFFSSSRPIFTPCNTSYAVRIPIAAVTFAPSSFNEPHILHLSPDMREPEGGTVIADNLEGKIVLKSSPSPLYIHSYT